MASRQHEHKEGSAARTEQAGDQGFDDLKRRLDGLEKRLDDQELQTAAGRRGSAPQEGKSDWAKAVRLSSEFIAGVIVGAGLGYFIDRLAGTAPWGMIIFLFLGFGAGVLNVLRSAGAIAKPDERLGKDGAGEGSDGKP